MRDEYIHQKNILYRKMIRSDIGYFFVKNLSCYLSISTVLPSSLALKAG